MKRNILYTASRTARGIGLLAVLLVALLPFASCSTTKNIPDDDQLFTGLTQIAYTNYEKGNHFIATQEEIEAALATAPNGALFGSSYYRTPFPYGLWVWNAFAGKTDGFSKWMTSSFGKQPVLMSWVNPALRASVAQSVLRNNGYFHGRVDYETVQQKNPKTAKIGYTVDMGHLFTLDTVAYVNFPAEADSLIAATADEAEIRTGSPFSVSALEAERQRVALLLRNNGYYYYQPGYASYLADTFATAGKAQLRFQLADDIPAQALHKWYIGRVNINMRRTFMEQTTDSTVRRFLTVRYSGTKPPIRPRVLLADMKLRPRQVYSYDNYLATASKINAMGLFSMTEFQFTPRDTTAQCDTLDLTLNCVFDKPWDFYVETNLRNRTIGRFGPELKLGLTRRNAFRGGEKIDVNVHGSYEWATSGSSSMSSYEYGADASIEFPRIIAPFFGGNRPVRRTAGGQPIRRRRLFYSTPTTIAKASTDVVRRPGYYKMHIVSGEWSYRWQTSEQSHHEFSPLTLKYQFMNSYTEQYAALTQENPYLLATMGDYCIPQMRYTYVYTSPKTLLNPIRWELTVSESGNLTSLGFLVAGEQWNAKDKKLFKNPYSQFVKLSTDLTKTWRLNQTSQLVGHVNAGVLWYYGNSDAAPFSEVFYIGGANSIRAFPARSIGPGRFPGIEGNRQASYLMQSGDIKLEMNLEYRKRLFGNVYGAAFVDAGNVWNLHSDIALGETLNALFDNASFQSRNFFRELAVGTGVGLRYDLDFLVLRLDWGIGLHVPYETGKSGFYNVDGFRKNQTLHFAIGYPF